MANLSFRAATSGSDTSFANSAISVTVPTTQAADMQLVWITCGDFAPAAAPTYTTPGGWTQLGASGQISIAGGLLNLRIYLFGKKATGADANQTFTASGNCAMGYVRASYSNPDPNGFFGQVTFGSGGPSTSLVMSAMTTARANSLLTGFVTQGTAQNITPASGMTERLDDGASGVSLADVIQAIAGSTGTKTFTLPAPADFGWAFAELYSNNVVTNVESITFADSQAAVAKFIGLQAEAIGLSDSQVSLARFLEAQGETIAFSDAQDVVFNQDAAQDESITLADSQDAEFVTIGLVDESISFSDSVDGLFHAVGVLTEQVTLTDSVAAVAHFVSAQDEAITLSDSQDATEPSESFVVEQITLLDSQTATQVSTAQISESITFIDLVTASGDDPIIDTHDGFWVREWKKMIEREKKLNIEDVIEIVEESPQEVLEALPEVKREVKKEFGRVDYQKIANNLRMQTFIAERILIQLEVRKLELEEDDLEVLLLM